MTSFVYSNGLIEVHPAGSHAVIEREGYGKEFSNDEKKRITLYREGSFVIVLSGDFIDIDMTVSTGEAAEKPVVSVQNTLDEDW